MQIITRRAATYSEKSNYVTEIIPVQTFLTIINNKIEGVNETKHKIIIIYFRYINKLLRIFMRQN